MISITDAVDLVLAAVPAPRSEEVPLLAAIGRVLSDDLVAPRPAPAFDNSAVDGFALRGADLAAGQREFSLTLEIPAGRWVETALSQGEAAKIMTGAPLPAGADTVVAVEQTTADATKVTVLQPPSLGANVRRAGEDGPAGETLLTRGTIVGPAELALLASCGQERVHVTRRPRVASLATGNEVVAPGTPLTPGQIYDSNSYGMYGQARAAGAEPLLLGIASDDPEETKRLLASALAADIVVTLGGVSVGEFDIIKQLQAELGVERRFWGVRTKPSKPTMFGVRGKTLVIGAPGNPAAAMICGELYLRPAILALQGATSIYRPYVWARAAAAVKRTRELTETSRCRLTYDSSGWTFHVTGPQGAGNLRSFALAEGLAFVPPAMYASGDPEERFLVMLLDGRSSERPPFPQYENDPSWPEWSAPA
jgi:molybdopterin molybdotransferase